MSDDFSPQERRLLHALQAADSPSDEEQLRVKHRVFAQLGLGVVAASSAGLGAGLAKAAASRAPESLLAPPAASGAAGLLGSTGVKLALGIATLLSAGAGVTYMVRATASDQGHGAHKLNQVIVAPAVTAVSPVAPALEPTSKEASGDTAQDALVVGAVQVNAPTPAGSARKSGLQRETELLTQAHQAIGAGRAREALNLLTEHQKQFPRGTLRIERQGALALARCLAGERARGRSEAETFRRQHPNSPMNQRLADACGLQSTSRSPNKTP